MAHNGLCDEISEYKTYIYDSIDKTNLFNNACNDLNVFHLNVRSICKNFNNLVSYLESLNKNFDIIALSETHDITYKINNLNISGYQLFFNESVINQCDGFLFYVKSELVTNVEVKQVNECKFLRIQIIKNKVCIGITGIYRCHDISSTSLVNSLEQLLHNLKSKCDAEIFCGDINIDLFNKKCEVVCSYLSTFNSLGYISKINNVTRDYKGSRTCIDHFFIKTKLKSEAIILKGSHSDHSPILLNISLAKNTTMQNKYIKFLDKEKLKLLLQSEKWEGVFEETNANVCADNLLNTLTKHIDFCTSEKYVKCKNRINKEWLTKGLLTSIRHRDFLKKCSAKQPLNNILNIEYTEYRKTLTKLLSTARTNYYKNLFSVHSNDPKQTWKTIKRATNEKLSDSVFPSIICEDGSTTNDSKNIAEEFNKYFCTIGIKLASKITRPRNKFAEVNRPPHSFFLKPMHRNDFVSILGALKSNNSCVVDNITNDIIKENSLYLLEPLLFLTNLIFSTGIYPNILKNTVVIPLHKSGPKDQLKNYRPIALTSSISKLIEKCIKLRLNQYINQFNLISSEQYGFKEKSNTEDALIRVTNHITSSFNTNKKCMTIFLDLAKAFDTVAHHVLLERLEQKGIVGLPNNLIKSYLENRQQQIKISNTLSSRRSVELGVPQGTVLGPLLFILYIDGLFSILPRDGVVCFADDTVLIIKGNNWSEVKSKAEEIMSVVKDWFDFSLLTLNTDKSKFICYAMSEIGLPTFNSLLIHQNHCKNDLSCNCVSRIASVDKIKYLGVFFDKFLKWDSHVSYVNNKLRKLLYKFYLLRQSMSKKCILRVYVTLAESIIAYGICIWGATYKSILTPLVITQKHLLKTCLFKNKLFPSVELFKEACVLSIQQLYINSVFRLLSMKKLEINKSNHQFLTRFQKNEMINFPIIKFEAIKRSLTFTVPKIYNIIPNEYKNKNYYKVKHTFKKWLLKLDCTTLLN